MVIETIISGLVGLVSGTLGYYYTNKFVERNREFNSTKREQLQYVFGPLDVLMKMNMKEFNRYFAEGTTSDDKSFIEQHIWYPNNSEIKRIIMEKSHLLPEIPDGFLELLTHINVWLTEYDLVYIKKIKDPPVFAGARGGGGRGYGIPNGLDDMISKRAHELRKSLNIE